MQERVERLPHDSGNILPTASRRTTSSPPDYEDCLVNAINWIQTEADKSKLVCANKRYYLLWDNSHTSWPKANCESFLKAAIELWKNW
jgi:hypothetical protein